MPPGKYKFGEGMCLKFSYFFIVFSVFVNSSPVSKNLSPNPIGGRFVPVIRPSQKLLPPHREENQSLDDIIYGFSSPLLAPLLPITTTTQRSNVFITSATPLPPPTSSPFIPMSNSVGGRFSNNNLVQTFTPPPPLLSREDIATTSRSSPFNSVSSGSAEEIKVPQPVKLRSQKKQYTKADLIAAANSIKPAGFDFNKVLIFTPSSFPNSSRQLVEVGNNKNQNGNGDIVKSIDQSRREDASSSSNSLSPLYHHVMFPLPLFDTPVFKPIMEMLMKQEANKFGALNTSDNRRVLVIIPKSAGLSSSPSPQTITARTAESSTGSQFPQQQRDQRSQQSQSKPPPINKTPRPTPSPKFINVPKENKASTTSKPKSSPTTKRIAKQVGQHTSGKTKEKDLQVAATSNKLSQRPKLGSNGNPSSTEKRSYSYKGDDKYSFSYAVKNDAFGDVKSHSESRDGDQVEGEYSMLEADGYTRVVRYTVDSDQGFKASVKRIPPS